MRVCACLSFFAMLEQKRLHAQTSLYPQSSLVPPELAQRDGMTTKIEATTKMLSMYYTTCPSENHMAEFLSQPENQQRLLDASTRRPSVHASAREHVLRFEVALELPDGLAEGATLDTEVRLVDLINTDHPLFRPLVQERHRYVIFMTDLVVQAGSNPFHSAAIGVRTNLVSLPLWGFEKGVVRGSDDEDVKQAVADEMGRQRFFFDQGYVHALKPSQRIDDHSVPPQLVRSASRKERIGLYTYGGCTQSHENRGIEETRTGIANTDDRDRDVGNGNTLRLQQGLIQMPSDSDWTIIETSHALYGQLLDYQQAHWNKAYLEYCEVQDERAEEAIHDVETLPQSAWLAGAYPRETEIPLTFRLGAASMPEEERPEFAVVPTMLLEQYCDESRAKLFYYLLHELPFDQARVSLEPISSSWSALYAKEKQKEQEQLQEPEHTQDSKRTLRLVLDMKIVIWEREELARSVCREIPCDKKKENQEREEHEALARQLGAVSI